MAILSIAASPASTMMIINQYKAKGAYVETMLQVIAYGNVIWKLTFISTLSFNFNIIFI